MIAAHGGAAPGPDDIWRAWHLDPLIIVALVAALWMYRRGRRRGRDSAAARRQQRRFVVAIAMVGVALVSPVDALSGSLASAHMVQHILLVLVAAPLLAASAPGIALLRASPAIVRRSVANWYARFAVTRRISALLREPLVVWLLHVLTLWLWHAAFLYDAALTHDATHALEHAMFLVTGVMFWRVLIGRAADRVSPGLGVLLVFGMAMQSVFLAALLTFARTPWYSGYQRTTAPWGLQPLADQQLAGVIMWIPAGVVYLAIALTLVVTWVGAPENSSRRQEASLS